MRSLLAGVLTLSMLTGCIQQQESAVEACRKLNQDLSMISLHDRFGAQVIYARCQKILFEHYERATGGPVGGSKE